ncbi:methyltransferase family protein [Paracoccus pacificus]|uniref:Methyltransferase family protein n=1 Tax=Paracoccus pacificus TaxID=1463598 RepID=A0ABW4R6D2_9RHOB
MMATLIRLPQVWVLGFAVIGWLLGRLVPVRLPLGLDLAGTFLIVAGIVLMIWAALIMRRAGTTVMPGQKPARLVTWGPFAFSRNPIYLGDALVLTGIMLAGHAVLGLIMVPAFILLANALFIRAEEAMLSREYGADFAAYCAVTRRWL